MPFHGTLGLVKERSERKPDRKGCKQKAFCSGAGSVERGTLKYRE